MRNYHYPDGRLATYRLSWLDHEIPAILAARRGLPMSRRNLVAQLAAGLHRELGEGVDNWVAAWARVRDLAEFGVLRIDERTRLVWLE